MTMQPKTFSTVFDTAEMQVLLMIASILSLAVGDFFWSVGGFHHWLLDYLT